MRGAIALVRLVEAAEVELTTNLSDLLPPEVAGLIGSQTREVRTRGDGACALHAAFATLGCSESLQLEDPQQREKREETRDKREERREKREERDKHDQHQRVEGRNGSVPGGAGWYSKGSVPKRQERREKREESRDK